MLQRLRRKPFIRPRPDSRQIGRLALAGAILCCAWVVADLGLRIARPPTVVASPRGENTPLNAVRLLQTVAPFGRSTMSPGDIPDTAVSNVKVIAIATGFGRAPGFAIVENGDGKRNTLLVGDALPDGRHIVALAAEHIELDVSGAVLRLAPGHPAAPVTPPPPQLGQGESPP